MEQGPQRTEENGIQKTGLFWNTRINLSIRKGDFLL